MVGSKAPCTRSSEQVLMKHSSSAQAGRLSQVEHSSEEKSLFSTEPLLSILELIFAGAPLNDVLAAIARLIEAQAEGMLCTIWLPSEDGTHVRCAAAPSIPGFY